MGLGDPDVAREILAGHDTAVRDVEPTRAVAQHDSTEVDVRNRLSYKGFRTSSVGAYVACSQQAAELR